MKSHHQCQQPPILCPTFRPTKMDPVPEVTKAAHKALRAARSIEITADNIINIAKSAVEGVSGGNAGYNPKMLAKAILADKTRSLANNYAQLATRHMAGEFFGLAGGGTFQAFAKLVGLRKKNGGARPIAIATPERRLLERAMMDALSDHLIELLIHHNCGVMRKGLDVYIQTIKMVREEVLKFDKSTIFFILDIQNAFNSVKRYLMIWLVQLFFPSIARYMLGVYEKPTILSMGAGVRVEAQCGVQQGSCLSNLGFGLLFLFVMLATRSVALLCRVAFWDDLTVAGEAEEVLRLIRMLNYLSKYTGLHMRWEKCHAHANGCDTIDQFRSTLAPYLPPEATSGPNSIHFHDDLNMTVLNQPVGDPDWTDDELIGKLLDEIEPMLERVVKMPQSHE